MATLPLEMPAQARFCFALSFDESCARERGFEQECHEASFRRLFHTGQEFIAPDPRVAPRHCEVEWSGQLGERWHYGYCRVVSFRAAEFVARCAVCKEIADHGCPRCGRPYCDEHAIPEGERCDTCEADFQHQTSALSKPAPKPLEGTFRVTSALPSLGFGVLVAMIALVVGVTGGLGASALAVAFLAGAMGTAAGALVTGAAYLLIGTPIFARRKLHEPVQRARRFLARRKFLGERKQLPSGQQTGLLEDGSARSDRDEEA